MKPAKLGELLLDKDVLSLQQVERVLARQLYDARPFGQIAADEFSIDISVVLRTLAEQLLPDAERVNLQAEPSTEEALRTLAAHDAWGHRALPLRYERGELVVATSEYELPNAIALLDREVYRDYRVVIADAHVLQQALMERYGNRGAGFRNRETAHHLAGEG